ncbi:unnamed protein product [Paramecium sonneborni]|uniref:Uncharacterized protein n=1 Tax=Paramecium sonneborni TaxID=65129 RepID=A0A8S1K899_9CILI|nr:unnamed protein product [Paramecium sonneborni]CAD8049266.1 unnamed protein product [Paramecium sonneborni]
MQQEKLIRKLYILPKVESCVRLDLDFRMNTPVHSMANKYYQGCYPKTTRSARSDELINTPTVTIITISSGKKIQFYAPMQESKRAQRLKNVPYELQYFQTKLPTKIFKSSHLMSEDLLNQPSESINNQQKWQMRSHINKMNKPFTSYQKKRSEQKLMKQIKSTDDLIFNKQQTEEIDVSQKLKRYHQYKRATQNLIRQFSNTNNINQQLCCDLQHTQQ